LVATKNENKEASEDIRDTDNASIFSNNDPFLDAKEHVFDKELLQQREDIPFSKKKRGRKKQPAEEYLKQARQKVHDIEAEYVEAKLLKKSASTKRKLRNQKTAM